jgi:hypothetical protein
METAKASGLDFLSLSWSPEEAHWHILDAMANAGLKATFLYESLCHAVKGTIPVSKLEAVLKDMSAISEYMEHPAWLRIDGKPVLMIYVTRAYTGDSSIVFGSIRKALGDVFLVGDELFWSDLNEARASEFDAVTSYNMYQTKRFTVGTPLETCESYLSSSFFRMNAHAEKCRQIGLPLWGNAMPGYNDHGVRPDRKHPPLPRLDGEFFKRSLADAEKVSVGRQALTVTSFNEFYEDTAIEPMVSYGTKYLDILKAFKERLK